MRKCLILICLTLSTLACNKEKKSSKRAAKENSIPVINISYVTEYPHDKNAFTEGLLFHKGKLYESTGATDLPQTRSLFGEVNLNTGEIDVKVELDREKYFGEGITYLNGRVFQLTYKSRTGFVYDEKTYQKIQEFRIPSDQGWGLTTDGNSLIMSDGTDKLTFIDPVSLTISREVYVKENYIAKEKLNELEYVNGYIYANVWMTNEIVKINPKNGEVAGRMDLTSYAVDAKNTFSGAVEMNGIAYNPNRHSFFITGKLWPKIYEIKNIDSTPKRIDQNTSSLDVSDPQNFKLVISRGAFHWDKFKLEGDLLSYIPSTEGGLEEFPAYNKMTTVNLNDSTIAAIARFIVQNDIFNMDDHYENSTTCNSMLQVEVQLSGKSKKIMCADYQRGCPSVLTELENLLIQLQGKGLKRIVLPG